MSERELAVVVSYDNEQCTIEQSIDAIGKAGYKNVFVQWYDNEPLYQQQKQVECCRQYGMNVIFAHLGYQKINSLWQEGEEGNRQVERYIQDLKDVAAIGIEMVVMHLSRKWVNPSANELGLQRIKKIVKAAEELKVKIAFENTRTLNQFYYVMNHIDSEYVGVCFDAGHWHCNNKENWDPRDFKGRIFAIHLHDNSGMDDEHLLPFDGTMNWPKTIKAINDCGYDGPITMELCYRGQYLSMGVEAFFKEGIKRGKALNELF